MSIPKLVVNNDYLYACGDSLQGGRKENQDKWLAMHDSHIANRLVLTVCDGMGGAAGGQTASHLAAQTIIGYLKEPHVYETPEEQLAGAIREANEAVYKKSVCEPELRGMGTTATILLLDENAAYVAHVGDSRIYQLRKGRKLFRTFDHSFVFDMVKARILTEEQARNHARSNVITRALGIHCDVEADIQTLPYKKGDRFVLCCDGVWNVKPEHEIIKLFTCSQDTHHCLETVMNTVDGLGRESGKQYDNMTCVMCDVKFNSKYKLSLIEMMHEILRKFKLMRK